MEHPQVATSSRWLGVWQGHILVREGEYLFADKPEPLSGLTVFGTHKVGQLDGQDVFVQCYSGRPQDCLFEKGQSSRLIGLRSFLSSTSASTFQMLGAACQLYAWEIDHRYCGRCGKETVLRTDDRCRYCQPCNHRYYPKVSPCVIMLVTRGDQCLLAVHERSTVQMFTALAGFVEPGETLEQAVVREVEEEVGLQVQGAEYIDSQPWPFPGQLMVGFLAEYKSGEISLQDQEITRAEWFHFNELPELIPPPETLSGQLIRAYVARRQGGQQYE
ncbi:NAD(+) diphosphatase [Simiduia agarivorans]|uniref:NAD(+) diphosphatase n=1 Tax=Simiduia agarivorans TaxID=447471 RepID=UPI000462C22A|nr:NAD(+) diphosphatase [Simiduia agarivorans]